MLQPFNLGDLVDRSPPTKLSSSIASIGSIARVLARFEIDALERACARGLFGRGFTRGDAVAILSANRAEYLVA